MTFDLFSDEPMPAEPTVKPDSLPLLNVKTYEVDLIGLSDNLNFNSTRIGYWDEKTCFNFVQNDQEILVTVADVCQFYIERMKDVQSELTSLLVENFGESAKTETQHTVVSNALKAYDKEGYFESKEVYCYTDIDVNFNSRLDKYANITEKLFLQNGMWFDRNEYVYIIKSNDGPRSHWMKLTKDKYAPTSGFTLHDYKLSVMLINECRKVVQLVNRILVLHVFPTSQMDVTTIKSQFIDDLTKNPKILLGVAPLVKRLVYCIPQLKETVHPNDHEIYLNSYNKLIATVRAPMKFGRIIRYMLGYTFNQTMIDHMTDQWRNTYPVIDTDKTYLHIARTAQEIEYAFTWRMTNHENLNYGNNLKLNATSCMRHPVNFKPNESHERPFNSCVYARGIHPSAIYESPDFYVIYVSNSETPMDTSATTMLYGRCVVGIQHPANPDYQRTSFNKYDSFVGHVFGPIYTTSNTGNTMMIKKMKEMLDGLGPEHKGFSSIQGYSIGVDDVIFGYHLNSWGGLKLKMIGITDDDWYSFKPNTMNLNASKRMYRIEGGQFKFIGSYLDCTSKLSIPYLDEAGVWWHSISHITTLGTEKIILPGTINALKTMAGSTILSKLNPDEFNDLYINELKWTSAHRGEHSYELTVKFKTKCDLCDKSYFAGDTYNQTNYHIFGIGQITTCGQPHCYDMALKKHNLNGSHLVQESFMENIYRELSLNRGGVTNDVFCEYINQHSNNGSTLIDNTSPDYIMLTTYDMYDVTSYVNTSKTIFDMIVQFAKDNPEYDKVLSNRYYIGAIKTDMKISELELVKTESGWCLKHQLVEYEPGKFAQSRYIRTQLNLHQCAIYKANQILKTSVPEFVDSDIDSHVTKSQTRRVFYRYKTGNVYSYSTPSSHDFFRVSLTFLNSQFNKDNKLINYDPDLKLWIYSTIKFEEFDFIVPTFERN